MVKPTMLMTGAKTTLDIMITAKILSRSFNKPNIRYFDAGKIINEMRNKDFNTAYQILRNYFGEFVTFTDKLPENFIPHNNPL